MQLQKKLRLTTRLPEKVYFMLAASLLRIYRVSRLF